MYCTGCSSVEQLLKIIEPVKHCMMSFVNTIQAEHKQNKSKLDEHPVGSSHWCMTQMKIVLYLGRVKGDAKAILGSLKPVGDWCVVCKGSMVYDCHTGDHVCQRCGVTDNRVDDSKLTFHQGGSYNHSVIHRYTIREHFSQTMCDFSGNGQRYVPPSILHACRMFLGTGSQVTSEKVFSVLQKMRHRKYYQHKYAIATRLRGNKEFTISCEEVDAMKERFRRYSKHFYDFQHECKVGKVSRRGKLRIFWPMRFILKKLCLEVGRPDLLKFVRGISGKQRLEQYNKQWDKLVEYTRVMFPDPLPTPTSSHQMNNEMIQLGQSKRAYASLGLGSNQQKRLTKFQGTTRQQQRRRRLLSSS